MEPTQSGRRPRTRTRRPNRRSRRSGVKIRAKRQQARALNVIKTLNQACSSNEQEPDASTVRSDSEPPQPQEGKPECIELTADFEEKTGNSLESPQTVVDSSY